MKTLLSSIMLLVAGIPLSATTLGLASITYPTHLPFNGAGAGIELRKLPFATRASHPEFIGMCLSAPYVVPHIDSANLPKDINLISVCGISINTGMFPDKNRGDEHPVGVDLHVDLRQFSKPEYVSFEDSEIILAVAKAISRTLASNRCEVRKVTVVGGDAQRKIRKLLEKRLVQAIPAPPVQPAPVD